MACCMDYQYIQCVENGCFSVLFAQGEKVPLAGIYRCTVCNRELVYHEGSIFGKCKKKNHPNDDASLWRLVIYCADSTDSQKSQCVKKEETQENICLKNDSVEKKESVNCLELYRVCSIGYPQKVVEIVQDNKRCKLYKKDGVVKLAISKVRINRYQKGDIIIIEDSLGLITDIDEFLNKYEILIGRIKKNYSLFNGELVPYISKKFNEKEILEYNIWTLMICHGINMDRAISVINGEIKLEKAISNQKKADRKGRIKRLMENRDFSKELASDVVDGKISLVDAIKKHKNKKPESPKSNDCYDNLKRAPGSFGSRQ